jgi:hypothetical protein
MRRFFLLYLALALCVARTAFAGEAVGAVTELKGNATVTRQGQRLDVTEAMRALVNDQFKTAARSALTITLTGGTRLMLSELTSIAIEPSVVTADRNSTSIIHLLAGQLRSIVAWLGASHGFLEVHTPNAIAAARGTDFEVAFIEGKPCPEEPSCRRYTTVGVYQGTVIVTNPTSPPGARPVDVTAGYQTNIPCELTPTSPAPWGVEELGTPEYN